MKTTAVIRQGQAGRVELLAGSHCSIPSSFLQGFAISNSVVLIIVRVCGWYILSVLEGKNGEMFLTGREWGFHQERATMESEEPRQGGTRNFVGCDRWEQQKRGTTQHHDQPRSSSSKRRRRVSRRLQIRTIDPCDVIAADRREAVRVVGWMCGTPQSGDQPSPNLDRLHTDRRIEGRKGP